MLQLRRHELHRYSDHAEIELHFGIADSFLNPNSARRDSLRLAELAIHLDKAATAWIENERTS